MLKKGAKIIVIDLEGEKGSEKFNLLLSAWKSHQYSTRDDNEQIDKDFEHVDTDLQFIPEDRIINYCKLQGLPIFANFTNRTCLVAISQKRHNKIRISNRAEARSSVLILCSRSRGCIGGKVTGFLMVNDQV